MSAIVAIVGRPNVGKSTLFNRLSRSRDALVDDRPGITRDRLYAPMTWEDTPMVIIDTGGFDETGHDPLINGVKEQVLRAIEEADRIIFMVDGKQGMMPGDQEVLQVLRRSQKPYFLAVNKIDGPEHDEKTFEFFQLGVKNVYPISAAHGYGLHAFMDHVAKDLPVEEKDEEEDRIRVAVLGRPNVGKSSLINRILGSDRLLVSEIPGTTRDSVDTLFEWEGAEYLLIDTAGLRRKARVKEKIDKFSMIKTLKSLDRCHIAVVLLDAAAGIAEQDARICGYAYDRGRGIVLGVNKWDLVKKSHEKRRHLENEIDRQLRFVSFAPRLNLSALTGERVTKIFEKIHLVHQEFTKRISTGEVNRAFEEMVHRHPPPQIGRGRVKIFYATQTGTRPPTFVIFVNRPDKVHLSYKRYLINQIKEQFDLRHTPVRVLMRKR